MRTDRGETFQQVDGNFLNPPIVELAIVLRMRPSTLPIAAAVGFVLDDFMVAQSNERFSLQPFTPSTQGFWSAKPWVEQVRVQGTFPPVTPSPQSILLSPRQERMIRIQDDFIAYNWRKVDLDYIGYDTILQELQRLFISVSQAVERLTGLRGSTPLSVSGVELRYVDRFTLATASLLNPSYDPAAQRLLSLISTTDVAKLEKPKHHRVLWSMDLSTSDQIASFDLDLMQRISAKDTLVNLITGYKAEGSMQDWKAITDLLNSGHDELIRRFREFIPEEIQREWE